MPRRRHVVRGGGGGGAHPHREVTRRDNPQQWELRHGYGRAERVVAVVPAPPLSAKAHIIAAGIPLATPAQQPGCVWRPRRLLATLRQGRARQNCACRRDHGARRRSRSRLRAQVGHLLQRLCFGTAPRAGPPPRHGCALLVVDDVAIIYGDLNLPKFSPRPSSISARAYARASVQCAAAAGCHRPTASCQ